MLRLSGPRLKLARAEKQIEALKLDITRAHKADDNRLRLQLKRRSYDGHPAATLVVTHVPIFSSDISLSVGEIVHNLRGSLDHFAWLLVPPTLRNKLTARAAEQIYFPMARKNRIFWSNVDRQIPGTTRTQRTFIERYQPYVRSPAGRAIRALRTLSNTDKHRFIVPALFFPLKVDWQIKYVGAETAKRIVRNNPGKELKLGAEFMTWTFNREPTSVRMNCLRVTSNLAFHPSLIRPTPGMDEEDVVRTLEAIYRTCKEILTHFEGTP